jgi:ABC-2 type transport system permease protein
MAQMEFKANFIISICTEIAFLFAKSLYIIVLFTAGLNINGLSPEQILMFIGSYTLITGIMDSVYYPNIAAIPEYVHMARINMYLTKPVNSLFMVSLFRSNVRIRHTAAQLRRFFRLQQFRYSLHLHFLSGIGL